MPGESVIIGRAQERLFMSSFIMPNLEEAESRLDSLFAECGFASDHPAMQDWVAVKFALKSARQNTVESPGTDNQQINGVR